MVITVSVTLYCQEKKEIKEKLKSLKGDVQEITIKTDKETITFNGKDAEYVFKNIKSKKKKRLKL
jgi:copper chaperone CopZ